MTMDNLFKQSLLHDVAPLLHLELKQSPAPSPLRDDSLSDESHQKPRSNSRLSLACAIAVVASCVHCFVPFLVSLPSAFVAALPLAVWMTLVLLATFFVPDHSLSLKRSFRELCVDRDSRLNVLDVFRVAAILWVIINHTGSEGRIDILERLPSADAFKRAVHEHPVFGPFLGNSALGVEIFLVLSGLLGARSWMRAAGTPFRHHYVSFIVRRVLRLFPSVAVFVYIAAGPIMKALLPRYHVTMVSSCGVKGILSHLTFTGNWQSTPTCMGYLWYLGLDMQLYVLAPLILSALHSSPRLAIAGVSLVAAVSAVLRAYVCTIYGVCNKSDVDIPFISYPDVDPKTMEGIYAGLWEMYGRPQTKCGPFLVGLLIGYATTLKTSIELKRRMSWLLFWSALAVAVGVVYAILPEYWWPDAGNTLYNTLYTALFRTVFASAIAVMIASLYYREFPPVHIPLWWSVLARLTFNAYLLHMPVVYIFNHVSYLQTASGPLELLVVLPAVAFVSFSAALAFYVFVESPLGRLSSSALSRLGL